MKPILGKIEVKGCESVVVQAWDDEAPHVVEMRFARPEPLRKIKMARERKTNKRTAP